jgi:hypothetical protein
MGEYPLVVGLNCLLMADVLVVERYKIWEYDNDRERVKS